MQFINHNYDPIFLGIILISAIFALIRGGVAEILSISSWFIALWLMHKFGNLINHFIPLSISNTFVRSLIIYIIIFIIVAIGIALIKKIFSKVISSLGLSGLNYFLGFLFGIIRGAFICSLIVILIEVFNLDANHDWQKARTYPLIKPIINLIVNSIPDNIKHLPPPSKNF